MDFETVEQFGRIYVVKNGVESAGFIERDNGGGWGRWDSVLVSVGSADEGIAAIASTMGDWYTTTEAAARLAEIGVFDKPPSAHDICLWARNGLLPGAIKITGKGGGGGRGGSWRIPEAGLAEFAKRRRQ